MKECPKCQQVCAYIGANMAECANKDCDLFTETQYKDFLEYCSKNKQTDSLWTKKENSEYEWNEFVKSIDEAFSQTFLSFSDDDDCDGA